MLSRPMFKKMFTSPWSSCMVQNEIPHACSLSSSKTSYRFDAMLYLCLCMQSFYTISFTSLVSILAHLQDIHTCTTLCDNMQRNRGINEIPGQSQVAYSAQHVAWSK